MLSVSEILAARRCPKKYAFQRSTEHVPLKRTSIPQALGTLRHQFERELKDTTLPSSGLSPESWFEDLWLMRIVEIRTLILEETGAQDIPSAANWPNHNKTKIGLRSTWKQNLETYSYDVNRKPAKLNFRKDISTSRNFDNYQRPDIAVGASLEEQLLVDSSLGIFGYPDQLHRVDEETIVIKDFKASLPKDSNMEDEYKTQLALYSALVRNLYRTQTEVQLIDSRNNILNIDVSVEFIAQTLDYVSDLELKGQGKPNQTLGITEHGQCSWCSFNQECVEYLSLGPSASIQNGGPAAHVWALKGKARSVEARDGFAVLAVEPDPRCSIYLEYVYVSNIKPDAAPEVGSTVSIGNLQKQSENLYRANWNSIVFVQQETQ